MADCRPYTTTVRPGDSWYRVASRFGIRAADLAAANGATFARILHPGDELVVPGKCAAAPTPTDAPFVWVTDTTDDTLEAWYLPGRPIIFIIVHDPVANDPDALLRYLRSNTRRVSYNDQIVPGHDGAPPKVHVLSDRDEWVGHAGSGTATDARTGTVYGARAGGNLNHVSWGESIFKTVADGGPFPPALYRAAVEVAAFRARQFDVDVQNILAHREVDPRRRGDPRGIDMNRFRGDVANAMNV